MCISTSILLPWPVLSGLDSDGHETCGVRSEGRLPTVPFPGTACTEGCEGGNLDAFTACVYFSTTARYLLNPNDANTSGLDEVSGPATPRQIDSTCIVGQIQLDASNPEVAKAKAFKENMGKL